MHAQVGWFLFVPWFLNPGLWFLVALAARSPWKGPRQSRSAPQQEVSFLGNASLASFRERRSCSHQLHPWFGITQPGWLQAVSWWQRAVKTAWVIFMTRTTLPIFAVSAVPASSTSCNNFNSFYAMASNDEANSRCLTSLVLFLSLSDLFQLTSLLDSGWCRAESSSQSGGICSDLPISK